MQFKLIALLTLAVASVNGAAHYKRGGELSVHPLHWFSGTNTAFQGTCKCASRSYTSADTQDAIDQGESGVYRGYVTYHDTFRGISYISSSYPHQYKNYEGLTFTCGGSTYYEFPILASGSLFDGSTSPGPDRVVFEYVIPVSSRDNLQRSPKSSPTAIPEISAVVLPILELRATTFCNARVKH